MARSSVLPTVVATAGRTRLSAGRFGSQRATPPVPKRRTRNRSKDSFQIPKRHCAGSFPAKPSSMRVLNSRQLPRSSPFRRIHMKRSLCLLTLLFLFATAGQAATLTFIGFGPTVPGLSPLNENPQHPQSSGMGTALVTWDTVTSQMTVNVVFSGLTTPNTAAHIHCCINPPGNAGVATTVPTFTGFPGGVTSGVYSHSFDMTSASSYNPAFVTSHGGTVGSAAAALLTGMQAGQSYLNIHTTQFPGGEMRGFLLTPIDI